MAFQFRLAAVLRYRESLEQREYLALQRIQMEIAQTEAQIQQCQERYTAARMHRETELARGIASIHLQAVCEEEFALEKHLEKLQAQRKALEGKRQQCLKTYQLARQKREVLDHLRMRQLDAYRRAQAKRQQNTLDDIFLSRYRRTQ